MITYDLFIDPFTQGAWPGRFFCVFFRVILAELVAGEVYLISLNFTLG